MSKSKPTQEDVAEAIWSTLIDAITDPSAKASAAWEAYAADFDKMSDQEIAHETRIAENDLQEAESWLEAVASWEAAGRPRSGETP